MSKVRSFHPAGSSSDAADGSSVGEASGSQAEIRELRRLLADAVDARTRAEQANAAKNKLLVKVAHDLRTPLSSMMLNAQRLREHEPLDRVALTRVSESLQRAVQQQTRLIDRMVDASLSDLAELPPPAASERSSGTGSPSSVTQLRGGQVRSLDRPGNAKQYSTLKDLRILYIDDDFRTREAVLEVLELTGARVALAASPADGMLALDVFKPHVILCDLDMPGEDGFDFVRKLRAREAGQVPAIPVLAFTGLA
ncbi:MAG TPA: response regulator, partial [Polyangiales bacterium]|nr:response regulator [Polyangiales bacterium]